MEMIQWSSDDVYSWLTVKLKRFDFGEMAKNLRDAKIDGAHIDESEQKDLRKYVRVPKGI